MISSFNRLRNEPNYRDAVSRSSSSSPPLPITSWSKPTPLKANRRRQTFPSKSPSGSPQPFGTTPTSTATSQLFQSESSGKSYNPVEFRHSLLGRQSSQGSPQPVPVKNLQPELGGDSRWMHSMANARKRPSAPSLFEAPTLFPNSLFCFSERQQQEDQLLSSTTNSIWNSEAIERLWSNCYNNEDDNNSINSNKQLLELAPLPRPPVAMKPRYVHVVRPKSPPKPERLKPKSIRSFNARLNSFATKGNYTEVLSLIESVRDGTLEINGTLNTYTYTILIKAYCMGGQLGLAHDMLEQMTTFEPSQRPNRFTYNTLMNACIRAGDIVSATKLFEMMDESDDEELQPDHVTYTTLMKGYALDGNMNAAEKLLDRLKNHPDSKCRPNQVTYNTLLKGYATMGDMAAADRIYADMSNASSGCTPDVVSINTMIGGHARQGDMAQAISYMTRMRDDEFTSVTFHAVIDGYARVGDVVMAERMFYQCERMRLLSPTVFQAMISGWILVYDFTSAERAFNRQRASDDPTLHPNVQTYAMMIQAYIDNGQTAFADTLLDELIEFGHSFPSLNLRPSTTIYEMLILAHISIGDLDYVAALLHEMQYDSHVTPNRLLLNTVLQAFVSNHEIESAVRLFNYMSSHDDPNCRPNFITDQLWKEIMSML